MPLIALDSRGCGLIIRSVLVWVLGLIFLRQDLCVAQAVLGAHTVFLSPPLSTDITAADTVMCSFCSSLGNSQTQVVYKYRLQSVFKGLQK